MEDFKPLVSIIIPVFNGERYIAEAIDSAVKQNYENIEIIVVDDGSKDKTEEIVRRYPKVKYIKKENGGVASALNKGILEAKGEYISWLSHDDIFHSNKIESQVKLLKELPREKRQNVFIYSAFEHMNEDLIVYDKFEPHKKYPLSKLQHKHFPAIFGLVNGCTTFISVDSLKDVGLFNEELFYTQDIDMWYRILPKVNVVYQNEITLISRKHKAQGTNNPDPRKVKEQNDLYKNMVNNLTIEDMVQMSGSEVAFLKQVIDFVYELNYIDAANYLEERVAKFENKKNNLLSGLIEGLIRITPMYRKYKDLKIENERLKKKVDYLSYKAEEKSPKD